MLELPVGLEDDFDALLIQLGELPDDLRVTVEEINDPVRLREVHRATIRSASLAEFIALLEAGSKS